MDYFDIIREVCSKNNLNSWVYDDGDYPQMGKSVLCVDSWEECKKLNSLLKEEFEKRGIDTSDVRYPNGEDSYVEFASYDNYVFADESFICDGCGKLFRKDDYANYFIPENGAGIFCEDCVKDEPDDYIDSLINNPKHCNTLLDAHNLEDYGFTRIGERYEAGWYGTYDNPADILNDILGEHPNAEVIFDVIKTHNPFATEYYAYVRYNDEDGE